MGVKGLQTYLNTKCRHAIVHVDIKEMAKDYRSYYDKDPIIIVDGNAFIHKIYRPELPWIYGGQWCEYIELIQKFVEVFKKVKVKLVFFFNGCVVDYKRPMWFSRRLRDIQKITTIFDLVKITGKQQDYESCFMMPAALSSLTPFVLKYKCGVEVYFSVEDTIRTIFEFAESNQCLAVFSQDTDLLIYNTVSYLSINELDIDTLKTVMYNRNILAQSLGLKVHDLPIFASLIGNNFISTEDLQVFHYLLIRGQYRGVSQGTNVFLSVAHYVSQIVGNHELKDVIHIIAQDVFRDQNKIKKLWTSVNSYCKKKLPLSVDPSSSNCVTSEIFQLIHDRHINCDNHFLIYNILKEFEYYSGIFMEYDGCQDMPSICSIMQPIRQRLYGLILSITNQPYDIWIRDKKFSQIAMPSNFQSKNSKLKVGINAVKEWCAGPDNPNIEQNIVAALPVDLENVSINISNLLAPCCDVNVRWKAFLACVYCSDICLNEIQQIKTKYVLPVILLHYLCTRPSGSLLLDYEVNAFLSHILTLPSVSSALKNLHVEKVDIKGVKLAALFLGGVSVILGVLGACNYPILHEDALPWNYFDGKFFHYKYLLAKEGASVDVLCDNEADVLKEFYYLKKIILGKLAIK